MAEPEPRPDATPAPTEGNRPAAPAAPATPTAPLRVPTGGLPQVHAALATALGEAGLGGQELHALFASGIRAVCVGCSLPVTGAELGELAVVGDSGSHRDLPAKLERLRLGFCPRNGCEARFFHVEITGPGRFDREQVLRRAGDLLSGRGDRPAMLRVPTVSTETRRAGRRLILIALGTSLAAFVIYRATFYRSQPIPFIQPKSPYAIEPQSLENSPR